MLTLITTILCVVCYCCHRNIKKRTEAAYRQQRQWLESDPNMEIYSVEQVSFKLEKTKQKAEKLLNFSFREMDSLSLFG